MRALLEDMKSGQVSVHDVPPPELRNGGILVRTAFSAISSGTEKASVAAGRKSLLGKALARPDLVRQVLDYARSNGVEAARQKVQGRLETLTALGYSCSGLVMEVSPGATGFQPGDRVACAGVGYATHGEINFVPANLAVRVPESVTLEAASLATIGAIAIQGVRQANVTFGETVAVIGVGLVGVLTIQILRAAGCRVVAIDASPERAAQAGAFGAQLHLTTTDPAAHAAVHSFSRYGVDAAVITAATRSSEPLELAAKLLRDRGRISVVGDVGMGVSRANMYRKELSLTMSRSYGPGRYDPAYEEEGQDYPIGYVRWTEKRNMEAFLDLLASRAIVPDRLLEVRFPVEEGGKAYSAVEAGAYTGIIDYHAEAVAPLPAARASREPAAAPRPLGQLRLGCIGAGSFARGVIFPPLRSCAGVVLTSVASTTGAVSASARSGFGFALAETPADLLSNPDVDAVFILTRHDSHAGYVTAALEQGKQVFVEKPLALTHEQLTSIRVAYSAALEKGQTPFLMVGYNRRFAPLTAKLKDFFRARTEPMFLNIRCNAGYIQRDSWIQDQANGGRIIGEVCHFVDWARFVIGCPVRELDAVALPDNDRYRRDNVTITMRFADGSLANLVYLANGDRSIPKEFFEVFSGGRIARLDDFRSLQLASNGKLEEIKGRQDKGHARELTLTTAAMLSGGAAPIPLAELVETTAITLAIEEALRTQKRVTLPLYNPDATL
jgi:predicted dehydrogenase